MASTIGPPFRDLDHKEIYEGIERRFKEERAQNLAVCFDKDNAVAASDIHAVELQKFLQLDTTHSATAVKWFHLFAPDMQTDCVDVIAKKYKLSTRLRAIMKSPNAASSSQSAHAPLRTESVPRDTSNTNVFHDKQARVLQSGQPDLEKAGRHSGQGRVAPDRFNHYNIVSRVWHFWSVDFSEKCLCIGYNSLSNLIVKQPQETKDQNISRRQKLHGKFAARQESRPEPEPNAVRLWNWLLVCDDNTVISIQESAGSAFEQAEKRGTSIEDPALLLYNTRRTLVNVLRHLSRQGMREADPINALSVRPHCSRDSQSAVDLSDSPGLLFYYLFDDWYTTFDLVANDECRYASVLDQLRRDMLREAEVSRIDQLHQAGQQLHVLKRLYGSYSLILDRILNRSGLQSGTLAKTDPAPSLEGRSAPHSTERSTQDQGFSEDGGKAFLVPLTPKASVRFERLRDRITMFALSEIEHCMEERESLVSYNFNLIAMKQAGAVEKLTRITILLAKVTILFMPVSVLTGYFSTQIDDLQHIYTAKTYWVSFAVTLLISVLFLAFFGFVSHTLEGGIIYRTTAQATIQPLQRMLKGRGRGSRRGGTGE